MPFPSAFLFPDSLFPLFPWHLNPVFPVAVIPSCHPEFFLKIIASTIQTTRNAIPFVGIDSITGAPAALPPHEGDDAARAASGKASMRAINAGMPNISPVGFFMRKKYLQSRNKSTFWVN
jgi:hypothetical protein